MQTRADLGTAPQLGAAIIHACLPSNFHDERWRAAYIERGDSLRIEALNTPGTDATKTKTGKTSKTEPKVSGGGGMGGPKTWPD